MAKVREYGCTMQHRGPGFFHSKDEQLNMHQNTQSLHIRLRGHWRDEMTKAYYEEIENETASEQDSVSPSPSAVVAERDEEMRVWREATDAKLKTLFENLPNFEQLQDLLVQIGAESVEMIEGRWNYVYASALETLLSSVPQIKNLQTLTLDVNAGHIDDTSASQEHAGLCASIAAVLPLIPKVRLRLRTSCDAIFPPLDDLSAQSIKLKSLALKLHVPYENGGPLCGGPFRCGGKESRSPQHYSEMVQAGRSFLDALKRVRKHGGARSASSHGLQRLCITWPGAPQGTCITTADIIRERMVMPGEEFFIYEDEGEDYWEVEERTNLRDCGDLDQIVPCLRKQNR